ncbi:MAG TPA: phosphoribosyltransferase family protein [Bordetella sp.]|jgi:predicted phosphoribosyltransferase|nr:phosphoribosyltransferase family protein [Bordetella sp.]
MSRFTNRTDAGVRLAQVLAACNLERPVVLALPRGGVPVAAEVAVVLQAPLDLLIARKIGVPGQPELAMGAVAEGLSPEIVRNDTIIDLAGISEDEFDAVLGHELAEIERRHERYIGARPRVNPAGCDVVLIDDGIATGATIKAALRQVRARGPRSVTLAVPVAPPAAVAALRAEADRVICLLIPDAFGAIGTFYDEFHQVRDEDVVELLSRFPPFAADSTASTD